MLRRVLLCVSLILALLVVQGPAAQFTAAQGWGSWYSSKSHPVGSADWWKANKKQAEFVPGNGYQVPGVEGYFDENGRPINAPVDEIVTNITGEEAPAGLLPGLDPKNSFRKAKVAMGLGPNQQIAKDALERGEQLLAAKDYAAAADQFETAVARWPKSGVSDRAQFLLGESYFFQDKYVEARDAYNALVEEQPNTKDLDTLIQRQWKIARYWESYYFEYKQEQRLKPNFLDDTRPMFDTIGHAIKTYESIRLNDPTGPRADDAIMATAGIYFKLRRFADSDYQYTLLRREYPRSEHQFDAHILGLQSKLQRYQGPNYDGGVLEEARDLLKRINSQFAGRLSIEEKDRLRKVRAEVQMAIEQRDLKLAQYYDNTEHYGAAALLYAGIGQDHSGSPVANEAKERLAELGGKPAEPPKKLAWFVEMFPENRERTRVALVPERTSTGNTRLADRDTEAGKVVPVSGTTTR